MTNLEEKTKSMFELEDNVFRHSDGILNSLFSDQFSEQTYLRYGKVENGLVEITLSQEQVAG